MSVHEMRSSTSVRVLSFDWPVCACVRLIMQVGKDLCIVFFLCAPSEKSRVNLCGLFTCLFPSE